MFVIPRALNSRLVLLFSCILLATGAIFGWTTAHDQADGLLAAMRHNSSVVVRNLADGCAHLLLVEDYAELENHLVTSAELPDIRRLLLSEPDGKLIWDVVHGPDGKVGSRAGVERIEVPVAARPAAKVEDGALVIWQPVEAGRLLGWIKAEYSLESIQQAQQNTWRRVAAMTLAWMISSAALLMLVLRPIVGAIARLGAFTKQLDEHKGEQIAVGIDVLEIVDLAASINEASLKLQASERQLLLQGESLRRLNRELRAISRCNEVLIRAEDEPALLHEICRIVCDEAGYLMAWVAYAEQDDAKSVRHVAWAGIEDGYLAGVNISWADDEHGHGPTGTAIRTGTTAYIDDFASDPAVAIWRDEALQRGYRSSIAVPLKGETSIFGALCIYAAEPGTFKANERHLLEELAGDLAYGIVALRTRAERKRANELIVELNADLERRVAERTAQLEAANKELEAFSYSVSHDLRAPLRALDGYAHILGEDEAANLSDEGHRLLERIRQSAHRMGLLIDDVLRFSRIARTEMNWEKTDMAALAHSVADELRGDYPATTVRVGDLPPATADRAMLRQVWANLIGNALKFSAKKERPEVEIGSETAGGETIYYVRDNGAGFDMAYADKLFGVFQRLHAEREFAGTGAGLAIVKRIVERHGGRIWAQAEAGAGATFRFTLAG